MIGSRRLGMQFALSILGGLFNCRAGTPGAAGGCL